MPVNYVTAISFVLQLLAIIVLMIIKASSPIALIWIFALLMGLGMGGWIPTLSMLTYKNFKLAAYGTLFGVFYMGNAVSAALGPLAAGQIFDSTHSYDRAFIIFIVLFSFSVPITLLIRRPTFLHAKGV